MNRSLPYNSLSYAQPGGRQSWPPEIDQRPLKVLHCLVVFTPPVERLPHLPFEDAPLDRVPLVPEDSGVGLKGLLIVGQCFSICRYAACLVPCLEEVLLGLLPLFCLCVMVGEDRCELVAPVGEEGLNGRGNLPVELEPFFRRMLS